MCKEDTISVNEMKMRVAEATEKGYHEGYVMGKKESGKTETVIKLLESICELLKG